MATKKTNPPTSTAAMLEVDLIAALDNVRGARLGEVADLAASIEAVGLLNPVTVRLAPVRDENGEGDLGVRYELVAGFRRLAAVRRLGWKTIPAVVTQAPSSTAGVRDVTALAQQLVENLQREDLDPLAEAEGLRQLAELAGSQSEAARLVGRSKGHVSKRIALLGLTPKAREAIDAGKITLQDAAELAQLKDPKAIDKVVEVYDRGTHPTTAHGHLTDALEEQKRDAASAKLAKEAAAKPANRNRQVVAAPDRASKWRQLEGHSYEGVLGIDPAAHVKEPCHRIVVGYFNRWDKDPRTVAYCADPARHAEDGESTLKVTDAEAIRKAKWEDERAAQKARQEKAQKRQDRIEAKADELAAGFTDRNAALKALSIYVVATADDHEKLTAALRVAGVEIPPEPEGDSWGPEFHAWARKLEELAGTIDSAADLYRAALAVVLRSGPVFPGRDEVDGWSNRVADLVGFKAPK